MLFKWTILFLLGFAIEPEGRNLPALPIKEYIAIALSQENPPLNIHEWMDYFRTKGWEVERGFSGILKTFEYATIPYEMPPNEPCMPLILDMLLCHKCKSCPLDLDALQRSRKCQETKRDETKQQIIALIENGTMHTDLFHFLKTKVRSTILGSVSVTLRVENCSYNDIVIHYGEWKRQNGAVINVSSSSQTSSLFIIGKLPVLSKCDIDEMKKISFCVPSPAVSSSEHKNTSSESEQEPVSKLIPRIVFSRILPLLCLAYAAHHLGRRIIFKRKRDEEEGIPLLSVSAESAGNIQSVQKFESLVCISPSITKFPQIHNCITKCEERYLKDMERFGELLNAISSLPKDHEDAKRTINTVKDVISNDFRRVRGMMKCLIAGLEMYCSISRNSVYYETSALEGNHSSIFETMNSAMNLLLIYGSDFHQEVDIELTDMLSDIKGLLEGTDIETVVSGSPWVWPEANYSEITSRQWRFAYFCERMQHLGDENIHAEMLKEYDDAFYKHMGVLSKLERWIVDSKDDTFIREATVSIQRSRVKIVRKFKMTREEMEIVLRVFSGTKRELDTYVRKKMEGLFSEAFQQFLIRWMADFMHKTLSYPGWQHATFSNYCHREMKQLLNGITVKAVPKELRSLLSNRALWERVFGDIDFRLESRKKRRENINRLGGKKNIYEENVPDYTLYSHDWLVLYTKGYYEPKTSDEPSRGVRRRLLGAART